MQRADCNACSFSFFSGYLSWTPPGIMEKYLSNITGKKKERKKIRGGLYAQ
jgi:hypothetical protein